MFVCFGPNVSNKISVISIFISLLMCYMWCSNVTQFISFWILCALLNLHFNVLLKKVDSSLRSSLICMLTPFNRMYSSDLCELNFEYGLPFFTTDTRKKNKSLNNRIFLIFFYYLRLNHWIHKCTDHVDESLRNHCESTKIKRSATIVGYHNIYSPRNCTCQGRWN